MRRQLLVQAWRHEAVQEQLPAEPVQAVLLDRKKWTGHSKDGVLYAQACPSTEDEELAVCPVSCVLC